MSTGEQVVLAASAYAEQVGEGSGHWMKVHLVDGTCLRGACYAPENGIMRMDVYEEGTGINYREPVWINLHMVSHVQIEW